MPFTLFYANSPLADGKMMQALHRFTIRKILGAIWWCFNASRLALSLSIYATLRAYDL